MSVRHLEMNFGGVAAVCRVSFEMQAGELLCIIGPNGAGKTTLINLLSGAFKPVSGEIIFENQNVIGMPLHKFARLGIVRKYQVPSYFHSMTPRDNLEVARLGAAARGENSNTDDILKLIGLTAVADSTIAGSLAHGQKQWLEIGMALMCRPKLIILDEPTAGMSREETDKTVEIVLDLKGKSAIIVIEHDMRFIRALNSRTIVMHQGKVIFEGIFSEIENNPIVRDIYLGRK